MARKTARPGRTLIMFFLGVAVTYGLVALAGTWKPELGLDLQGGTRITPDRRGRPDAETLEEARKIIDQRVNGSGVAEAEVTTQGNQFIVVEIPGYEPRGPRGDRQAPGPAAVPAGRLHRRGVAPLRHLGAPRPRSPPRPSRARASVAPTEPPTPEATAEARRRRRVRRRVAVRQRQPGPGRATATRRPSATPPSPTDARATPDRRDHRSPSSEERRGRADPAARGRRGRRRPADLGRQPQPGGGRRLQRVHLPARRRAGQRRGRPGEAAGHLRHRTSDGREVPPVRRGDRGHRARRRQRPASRRARSTTSSPSSSTATAPRPSPTSPGRWSAPRSSSRSCSTARSSPRRRWTR